MSKRMVLKAASGTKLNSAEPGDIELLSSVFADLSAILANKRVNPEWRGLHSVGCILSEALSYLDAHEEPPTAEPLELDSDVEDETWAEVWEVQQLLEWLITTPSTSLSANAEPQTPELAAETTAQDGFKQRHQSNSISLLPTELLCDIFEYACAPRSLTLFSPLILSQVNSHFRSIVLEMPSLWSTIDDTFPLPIAKLYFERSIGTPLDIRIGSNGSLAVENVNQLFDYLEPHAHRVQALKVVTDDWDVMESLDHMMARGISFGSLEKLEFGRWGNHQPSGGDLGFKLDEGNSLQELHLWAHALDEWIDVSLTALRRLHLSEVEISFRVLVAAVEQSPGLSILVLEDCVLLGNTETVVTAGRLVELKFIRISWVDMIVFARLIFTPALTSLSVVGPSSSVNPICLVNLMKSSRGILSVEICDYDMRSKH
ncbi:hypothetical protein FRC00_006724, partial [Tulasnella sp. 408]